MDNAMESFMENIFPFIFSGMFIAVFITIIVISVINVKNYEATIRRAQQIDPTVKTISEAQYVLQKDIAKDFGSNKNNK